MKKSRYTDELIVGFLRQAEAVKATAGNDGIVVTVAAKYGGQWDIVKAVRRRQAAKFLSTDDMPDPELLIRTGGEQRINSFLLWQVAYAELYFTDVPWPEFYNDRLALALDWYQTRRQRFGHVEP